MCDCQVGLNPLLSYLIVATRQSVRPSRASDFLETKKS